MKAKRTIYKIVIFSVVAVVIGGLGTLLLAANKKNDSGVCNGITVKIKGDGDAHFVHEDDVLKAIQTSANGSPVNKPLSAIDLSQLEKNLQGNAWIEDAELYFDSKNYLNVLVKEREPLARVFTTEGNSFYIDDKSYQLPVPDKALRLQVITGFTAAKIWSAKDSAVMNDAKKIVRFIGRDPFWNAQVGEINIAAAGFELVPVIGDHIIRIGSGDDIEQKLHRAFIFYKQVLSKEGFNKYAVLDVQYDGQVVAVKKEPTSKGDAAQLQKNIDELLQRKKLTEENETPIEQKEQTKSVEAEKNTTEKNSVPVKTISDPKKNAQVKKSTVQGKMIKREKQETKKTQSPKAVMKKNVENEY